MIFPSVIQMAEDRASPVAMVKMTMEKIVCGVCEQNMAGKEDFGLLPAEER